MLETSLTLKVLSPLALHQSRASAQFAPTLDYIPGSTLRGALANLYLRGDPSRAQTADFRALFLEDRVFYPDLLPATSPGEPWHLVPTTAWACKRFGAEQPGSVTDTLLRLELAEALREQGCPDWQRPLEDSKDCPVCQNRYPRLSEYRPRDRLSGYAVSVEPFIASEIKKRLRTGTAVDRATGAVASGMLFAQQVIDSDQWFTGQLRLADDQAARLEQLLKGLAPEGARLYLGYGRSRGLGHVQVTHWQPAAPADPSFDQRWQRFNRTVQRLWVHYQADIPSAFYFSLTLTGHLGLRDPGGQAVLDHIQLAHLGLPWASLGLRNLEAVAVSGWNAAWGLPKSDTWALKRGSVLLGRISPADEAATLARLAELEAVGAGDRRAEGFGRLRACDEFHYVYTSQELV